ncbi:MAG: amidase family protein [Nevskia sp.]|nr:amidase family protein [Nevskia sp.]
MFRTTRSLAAALLFAALTAAADPAPAQFRLEEATIADIKAAFDAHALTSKQLVQLYLDRIAAYEDGGPRLNSITTLNPKALETAAALDAERKAGRVRGALHGIPVLLKDNVDTYDLPTSNGSVILRNAVPPKDATIARALRDAGAVILGKASMGEFAGGSYNTIDGQVVNPYNFKRQTGGSSAGPAAALAANFAVLAVGTDTSTSVRGPSAFNGVVGLRPTTGLISRAGIAPKNLNFDTAGPMARTVTDMAALLSVIAGPDPADPRGLKVWREELKKSGAKAGSKHIDYTRFLDAGALKGVRLGVVRDFFGGDPEIDALAEAAIAKMKALGAETVEIHLDPAFVDAYLAKGGQNIRKIADYRFKADWETYLREFGPDTPKTVAQFVDIYENQVNKSPLPVEDSVLKLLKNSLTTSTDDPDYKKLIAKTLPEGTRLKLALFDIYKVDALVFPYQSNFAAPISNPVNKVDDPTFVKSDRPQPSIFAGYDSIGFPGIVVPMGFGSQGLPMDISFMGRPYEEGRLIGYAYAYEQATKMRKPSPLLPALAGETIGYPLVGAR